MKRLIYLAYYTKKLKYKTFKTYLEFAKLKTNRNRFLISLDVIKSVFIYNISIMDYFYFRFFEKTHTERKLWAGTGYMYEFQLKMNPNKHRKTLEDKRLFLNVYRDFVAHASVTLEELKLGETAKINGVLNNPSKKIVFKDSLSQCGLGVEIVGVDNWTIESLIKYMESNRYNLLESFVQQEKSLQQLSPSGLNTVRIFTLLDDQGNVLILGCRLRISVNSNIDNLASGNMAVVIDECTGKITSDGVFSDITKDKCSFHPITNVKLFGFQLPFWNETLELVKNAAEFKKENRSVGWDIAITDQGPELIEGNHNWCKLLWQLPLEKGLKHLIEPFK